MPVAANARIALSATDPTAPAQPDGAAPAEMFGEIISGLAETNVESALQTPLPVAAVAVSAEPPSPAGESEVAEAVEQLLALVASHPAGARAAKPSIGEVSKEELPTGAEMPIAVQEPGAGKDVPIQQVVVGLLPATNPLPQYRTVKSAAQVETTVSSTGQAQPDTIALSDLGQTALSQPNVAMSQAPADLAKAATAPAPTVGAKVAVADPLGQASSLAATDPVPAQTPQIASSRTEAAVQIALSGLEAAVEAVPAHTPTIRSSSSAKRGGEIEPSISRSELKLTTAMTLPPINPVAAAFELVRPADALQIGTQSTPQPLDAAELVVEHQLDLAHEGEWLDQLARDISRSVGSDSSPLRFRLNPENLGSRRVEISQDHGGAAVRLTADTEAARVIIADAQPRLIAEARAQGIRISETHVELGGQTASGDPRRQNPEFDEAPLRTARSLQEDGEGDGNPTPGRSERYA